MLGDLARREEPRHRSPIVGEVYPLPPADLLEHVGTQPAVDVVGAGAPLVHARAHRVLVACGSRDGRICAAGVRGSSSGSITGHWRELYALDDGGDYLAATHINDQQLLRWRRDSQPCGGLTACHWYWAGTGSLAVKQSDAQG